MALSCFFLGWTGVNRKSFYYPKVSRLFHAAPRMSLAGLVFYVAIFPLLHYLVCLTLFILSLVIYRDSAGHNRVFLFARPGTLTRMRGKTFQLTTERALYDWLTALVYLSMGDFLHLLFHILSFLISASFHRAFERASEQTSHFSSSLACSSPYFLSQHLIPTMGHPPGETYMDSDQGSGIAFNTPLSVLLSPFRTRFVVYAFGA